MSRDNALVQLCMGMIPGIHVVSKQGSNFKARTWMETWLSNVRVMIVSPRFLKGCDAQIGTRIIYKWIDHTIDYNVNDGDDGGFGKENVRIHEILECTGVSQENLLQAKVTSANKLTYQCGKLSRPQGHRIYQVCF